MTIRFSFTAASVFLFALAPAAQAMTVAECNKLAVDLNKRIVEFKKTDAELVTEAEELATYLDEVSEAERMVQFNKNYSEVKMMAEDYDARKQAYDSQLQIHQQNNTSLMLSKQRYQRSCSARK